MAKVIHSPKEIKRSVDSSSKAENPLNGQTGTTALPQKSPHWLS